MRKLLCLCLALTFVLGASAQDLKFLNPEKFERATATDDKGMVTWAEFAPVKCPTCAGTTKMKCITCARFPDEVKNCPECKRNEKREATCRACGGTGAFSDPLEKVLCPGCRGAGFLVCEVCGGGGQLKVDKAKQWSDCPGCRGEGGWKCGVCAGARLVEVANPKPSLKDANVATLTKALAATEQALKALDTMTVAGGLTARKEVKALVKALESAQSLHPALKRTPKVLEDFLSKTYGGAQFQGHEEHEANAINLVRENVMAYLKHQKRMMELCLKRAEANAKVEADNKGK